MADYSYQPAAVEHAVRQLTAGVKRTLYAAPTGSGKSVIELAVQSAVAGSWIVTPRIEIVAGMLAKSGLQTSGLSEAALVDTAWQRALTTPLRLRNRLLAGGLAPAFLILDEAHHDSASTWTDLPTLCDCPAVGYTATPFRGAPESTRKFLANWGEPIWILTFADAVRRGVITVPSCRTASGAPAVAAAAVSAGPMPRSTPAVTSDT